MLKKFISSNSIIISLIFLFLISFSYLAYLEKSQHKIENGWFLYFDSLADKNADFSIENYSTNESFQWEIIADDKSIKKEHLQVLKGERKNVTIDEQLDWRKLKIIVYNSKEYKEIYKNFEQ